MLYWRLEKCLELRAGKDIKSLELTGLFHGNSVSGEGNADSGGLACQGYREADSMRLFMGWLLVSWC